MNSGLIKKFSSVRALVLGDAMLDRYEYGATGRMSPEAPVPVFTPREAKSMPGGAGNLAANLAALGCRVRLLTRTGRDDEGRELLARCPRGVRTSAFHQKGFPTPVKIRLIAASNHLLRIDKEQPLEVPPELAARIAAQAGRALPQADIVLLSDYGKGLLSPLLCREVITRVRAAGKPVVVDPKGTDYAKYAGATLVKPNLKELALVSGRDFDVRAPGFLASVEEAARKLALRHSLGGVLVTLSEHGMLYAQADKSQTALHLPTLAREVSDVSGAGDTTLAALGAALGAGMDIQNAMTAANAAAGVAVSKLGTTTVSQKELAAALSGTPSEGPAGKVKSLSEMRRICAALRSEKKTIGFTNGCFDCCHLGHLRSLRRTRELCDVLVVGLNSDAWIRRYKGADRPIQDEPTRAELLASLEFVDYVVVFGEKTALPLVRALRPDVIAKEGYPLEKWPEGRFVAAYGGRAVVLDRVEGYSTTALARKMKA